MKWIRKVVLVLLAILLILIGVQLIHYWKARSSDPDATFIQPRVLVTNLRITDHDPDKTRMLMNVQLVDPAPIGLALDSLSYSLGIEGVEVVHSSYEQAINVAAYDTANISFPVVVDSRELLHRLKELDAKGLDSVHYDLNVRFHSPLLFWREKPVEVHTTVYAPLYKIPQVALSHPRIEKLGLKNSNVTVDMSMYNPNAFPFDFKKTRMKLRMGDGQVFATRIDSTVHVPRQDTVVIRLPVELAPGQLVEAAFSALVKPSKTPFSYRLSLILVSDNPSLNNSAFVLTGKGVVADLEK